MRLKKILYKLKQSILYMGDVALAKSGKTPGCAKCWDIESRLGFRLCASLPPASDVDVVGMDFSPEWAEVAARAPGVRRVHIMTNSPRAANTGRFAVINPEFLAHPRIPAESLLHRCDAVAERYIVAVSECAVAAPADFFTPNGIPVYYRPDAVPLDTGALSICPDEVFRRIEEKGGKPCPGFIPGGGAYAQTKENSAEIELFLRDFSVRRRINAIDYAFVTTHWALAFGRGIA